MALDEQLRELANRVPDPLAGDATLMFRRGQRRRRARQAVNLSAVASVVAGVAVLGGGVASLLDTQPRLPEVADQPDQSDDHIGHPEGWVVLRAGDLEISVPSDWHVETRESPASQDTLLAGPCAHDLYGELDDRAGQIDSPQAIIHLTETNGICRLVALWPDRPPAHPGLVLYAGIAEGWGTDVPPNEASHVRIGAVDMFSLPVEGFDHVARFQRRDGRSGLLVSHLDDSLVQEVLSTLRTPND
jgi:hypothetical protein